MPAKYAIHVCDHKNNFVGLWHRHTSGEMYLLYIKNTKSGEVATWPFYHQAKAFANSIRFTPKNKAVDINIVKLP